MPKWFAYIALHINLYVCSGTVCLLDCEWSPGDSLRRFPPISLSCWNDFQIFFFSFLIFADTAMWCIFSSLCGCFVDWCSVNSVQWTVVHRLGLTVGKFITFDLCSVETTSLGLAAAEVSHTRRRMLPIVLALHLFSFGIISSSWSSLKKGLI